ncbi:MAG: NitT/TauT family transport system substrate-binding protein [Candidatus Petromonas sp.]|jgi:NitT/TauT family transport system substrate-binding protein|nr:NitT/TauT family transport system substrate-binding protein [Candidatus Petromonas sp.]
MKKVMKVLLTLIIAFLAVGCGAESVADKDTNEDLALKIGIMPAVDSAPILLAEKRGYFKELGLDIDIKIYTNAVNRQSALQSGELDGAMTDLIAFVNNIQNGFDIKITTSTDGSFPILVNKDFKEKKNVKVGMMEVSVSNFLSDQYLGDKYNMEKIYISEIPARLEMIKAGQMDMAVIPEPIASMGELSGLEKRVYKNNDEFMPEAMIFTSRAIKEKEKAIKLFHQAFNRAVNDIQKNEDLARDVLIERIKLKPEIKDLIALPKYHNTRVPNKEYMEKIIDWIENVQGVDIDVKYDDMVERKFIY